MNKTTSSKIIEVLMYANKIKRSEAKSILMGYKQHLLSEKTETFKTKAKNG